MLRISANVAHALLTKVPSIALIFVFIGMAQSTEEEVSIVSIYISLQTFGFIVTQPSYLGILRDGTLRYMDAVVWFVICAIGILALDASFELQGYLSSILIFGLLSQMRGMLIALGLRLKPTLLVKYEIFATFLNLCLLLYLWFNNYYHWAGIAGMLIVFAIVEITVLAAPFFRKLVHDSLDFDDLTFLGSIKFGFIVLSGSAYTMIIISDISRELTLIGGVMASAFSASFLARSALGVVSSGINTYIISSGDRANRASLISIFLSFVAVFTLTLSLSYATLAANLVSSQAAFIDIALISIFFTSCFISSLLNSELFRKSSVLSAISGASILIAYFLISSIFSFSDYFATLTISFLIAAIPTILLNRLSL